jgi:hypothetical protein
VRSEKLILLWGGGYRMVEVYCGRQRLIRRVVVYNPRLRCAVKLVMSRFVIHLSFGLNCVGIRGDKHFKHVYSSELEAMFDFWGSEFLHRVWISDLRSYSLISMGEGGDFPIMKQEYNQVVDEEKKEFWIYIVNLFLAQKINSKLDSGYTIICDKVNYGKFVQYIYRQMICEGELGRDASVNKMLLAYGRAMGWGEGEVERGRVKKLIFTLLFYY